MIEFCYLQKKTTFLGNKINRLSNLKTQFTQIMFFCADRAQRFLIAFSYPLSSYTRG